MDVGQDRIGCFDVLRVLSLELFKLARQFLLERLERVWSQRVVIIVLLQKLDDVQKLLLAIEMVLVRRV